MSRAGFPTLAFSTLACPEWDPSTVVGRAVRDGYDGIEWRGGPDGTVRTEWSAAERADLRDRAEDAGIRSIAVTTYTNLVSGDRGAVAASVADAVDHAELAADLGAPTIRVFLGISDDEADRATLAGRAVDAIHELLDRVRPIGVGVAIEPHDDHVLATSIAPVLRAIADPRLGVVWDLGNGWSGGEAPADAWPVYEGRIRYVQVKDGTGRAESWTLCNLGEGDVPIGDALDRLARAVAAGDADWPPVCVEWERAWHPELEPADTVLAPARQWLASQVRTAIERARLRPHP